MFHNLKKKWKVNGWKLFIILLVFAIGGSLCGWLGRKILVYTGIEKGIWWILLYILLITCLWPLCVLLVSIPFGQFNFFQGYIRRIFARMSGKHGEPKN